MITLGKQVQDTVTRFKGIATARIEYLDGRVQYAVEPETKDGSMPDAAWIERTRLIELGDGIHAARPAVSHPPR